MGTNLILSGLVEKRAELAGEIRQAEDRLEQMHSDILHVDATIRLIDPSYHTDAIVPKARRQRRERFANGELFRLILDTLRRSPDAMTSREVALALMQRKGYDTQDAATVRLVEKRVDATVRRRERLIERVVYGPRSIGWRVAD